MFFKDVKETDKGKSRFGPAMLCRDFAFDTQVIDIVALYDAPFSVL